MGIREEVYYEGGPHIGDVILNVLLSVFIVTIPLAVGAVVRAVWLRFRITDRRVSVTGGWRGQNRADVIYSDIVKVNKVPRGIGLWGDMVLFLKDGSKVELRAMPRYKEVYAYIIDRVAAKTKKSLEA
ncbi:PH domain-containing protein [Prochlorothrix hollandica]|uniref:Ribonuclease P n=1 Tax=Prochlorothrix hollandica PCC 9006 = CALU 1027 TaxID=317619 RepID=A0A0M2PNC3_PROHO|nr:PH domain-containing protein [Prochlorothrix hollandica]KKI98115.1 ribonuclease P [Prochlorothrix hollandica PCC 9006 = CALU 1027]